MATLQQLKNRIEKDIHRTDLSADVSDAISYAIDFYNKQRFWFLEGSWTFTASASQAAYAVASDLKMVDTALINISGSRTPLTKVHYTELDEKDDGRTFGAPSQWTFYNNSIRFYPVPDSATYIFTISYHKSLDAPSDSGSNAWTGAGFELIRHRAAADVLLHRIWNKEEAVNAKGSEQEALFSVLDETIRKISTGKLRKTGF